MARHSCDRCGGRVTWRYQGQHDGVRNPGPGARRVYVCDDCGRLTRRPREHADRLGVVLVVLGLAWLVWLVLGAVLTAVIGPF